MPRKGSPYGPAHERARAKLLASRPLCVYCVEEGRRRLATVADHQPPLESHPGGRRSHREGSGCCHYVPSCVQHSVLQGGQLRAAQSRRSPAAVLREDGDDGPEPTGLEVDDPLWETAPWLDELRVVPEDATWPRLMTEPHPDAVGTYGPEFVEWCRSEYGVTLRWWQVLVVYRLLEHDAAGAFVWRVLVLSMARQMGKSTLLCALLLWRVIHGAARFGERQLILHVARDAGTARETQLDARLWAGLRPDEFKVIEANGKEMIEHKATRSRWVVRAETSVKGWSATSALVDECWDVKDSTVSSHIRPTLISHEQPWLLLTSTAAVDEQATTLFPDLRATTAMTLDRPDQDLFIEWSAPRDAGMEDRAAWRLASPHWTSAREHEVAGEVAKALELGGKKIDGVRAEWFNIWPKTVAPAEKGEPLFGQGVWDAAEFDMETPGPLVLAVEDWLGHGAAVAAVGFADDGRMVVGGHCLETRDRAYRWVRGWCEQRPGSVVVCGKSLIDDPELQEMPGVVEARTSVDAASGFALLRELVAAGSVVHDGSRDVAGQIGETRVAVTATGALTVVGAGMRLDLARCVAWAVAEAHRGYAPAVH